MTSAVLALDAQPAAAASPFYGRVLLTTCTIPAHVTGLRVLWGAGRGEEGQLWATVGWRVD